MGACHPLQCCIIDALYNSPTRRNRVECFEDDRNVCIHAYATSLFSSHNYDAGVVVYGSEFIFKPGIGIKEGVPVSSSLTGKRFELFNVGPIPKTMSRSGLDAIIKELKDVFSPTQNNYSSLDFAQELIRRVLRQQLLPSTRRYRLPSALTESKIPRSCPLSRCLPHSWIKSQVIHDFDEMRGPVFADDISIMSEPTEYLCMKTDLKMKVQRGVSVPWTHSNMLTKRQPPGGGECHHHIKKTSSMNSSDQTLIQKYKGASLAHGFSVTLSDTDIANLGNKRNQTPQRAFSFRFQPELASQIRERPETDSLSSPVVGSSPRSSYQLSPKLGTPNLDSD